MTAPGPYAVSLVVASPLRRGEFVFWHYRTDTQAEAVAKLLRRANFSTRTEPWKPSNRIGQVWKP